jgi:hypothetical protein
MKEDELLTSFNITEQVCSGGNASDSHSGDTWNLSWITHYPD